MPTISRRITVTPDDQVENRYRRVEFEVVEGCPSVGVAIVLDPPDGAEAVVDLGCEGAGGWRGWSGGARRDFVIAAEQATPGYRPGPLEPGTWAVVLGLHQLPPVPVPITVLISLPADRAPEVEELAPVAAQTVRGSARDLPAPAGLHWYAGDLHAHTVHSDGDETIDALAARAVRSGLDFLAVTDHNTVSHHALLPRSAARQGVTLLPGQEVTTHLGHANAFGDIGWIDFRTAGAQWVAETAARGGLLSLNHPIETDCAWQFPLAEPPAAVEAFHIGWFRDLTATGPCAYLARLAGPDGRLPVLLGGSDFHHRDSAWTLGTPTTWVLAESVEPDAVLAALHAGRTAISVGVRPDATPDPLHTPVLLRLGDELVACAADQTFLVDGLGRARRIRGERATLPADGVPPYRLVDPLRRTVALSA